MTPTFSPHLLRQADFILDACGRPQPPAATSWVDLPVHVGYSQTIAGNETTTKGILHKWPFPVMLRAITAQSLPRDTTGVYWRLRLPNGHYFQNALTGHSMAFGFGSMRQSINPEVEWRPGDKLYLDLDTHQSNTQYSVAMMFEGVLRIPITGRGAVSNPLAVNTPRYYQGENQNILAPEWMYGPQCPNETPAGFQDEEFKYVSPTADLPIGVAPSTVGATKSNIRTQIEPGRDFYIREIWANFPGVSPNGTAQGNGSVVVRMRRGDGYVLMSNFVPINTIQGPIFKELKVKGSDSIYFDAHAVDTSGGVGSVITFGLYFFGVRRWRAQ